MSNELTDEQLRQIMPNAPKVKRRSALPILNDTMRFYDINNERRAAAWLATLAVESGELKYQEEIASGSAYDKRADLGNTRPVAIKLAREAGTTPGRFYKGHARIQVTGYDNHAAYTEYLKRRKHLPFIDFTREPQRLAEEPYATDSAGWFWAVFNDLNSLADKRRFLATQIRVNGRNKSGYPNHWAERKAYYERALRVLPDDFSLTSGEHAEDDEEPDFDPQTSVGDVVDTAPALTTENRPQPAPASNTAVTLTGAGPDDRPVAVVAASPARERSLKSLITMIGAALAAVGVPLATLYERGIEAFKDNPAAAFVVTIIAVAAVAMAWMYVGRQTTLDVADRAHARDVTLKTMDIRADPERINVEVTPKAVPPEAEGVTP